MSPLCIAGELTQALLVATVVVLLVRSGRWAALAISGTGSLLVAALAAIPLFPDTPGWPAGLWLLLGWHAVAALIGLAGIVIAFVRLAAAE